MKNAISLTNSMTNEVVMFKAVETVYPSSHSEHNFLLFGNTISRTESLYKVKE